jgi:hypothetical protein
MLAAKQSIMCYSTITYNGGFGMECFYSLSSFYLHYGNHQRFITLEDVDNLQLQLRESGYYVKEYKNGTIIVKTPSELKAAHNRRLAVQRNEAAKYTKLGASIPIPIAKAFSDACRKLGSSQSDILMPFILDTIERATKIDHDGL